MTDIELKTRNWISGHAIKGGQGVDPITWIDERCKNTSTELLEEEYSELSVFYITGVRPHGWTNDDVYTYLMQTRLALKGRGVVVALPWSQ